MDLDELKEQRKELAWRAKGMKRSGMSLRATAAKLGVSLSKAWRLVGGGSGGTPPGKRRRNSLETWILAHPAIELPRTLKELSELTGISSRYLSGMIAQRRKKLEAWVAEIGDLHARAAVLRASDGTRLTTASLARWTWEVDPFRGSVGLRVVTICGEEFLVPIPDRREWALEWRRSPRREDLA